MARKRYSQQFEDGALWLVTRKGYSIDDAARQLDVDSSTLRDWLGTTRGHWDA